VDGDSAPPEAPAAIDPAGVGFGVRPADDGFGEDFPGLGLGDPSEKITEVSRSSRLLVSTPQNDG
jgi:hypothetical protein